MSYRKYAFFDFLHYGLSCGCHPQPETTENILQSYRNKIVSPDEIKDIDGGE
jgi:hypothetical protein